MKNIISLLFFFAISFSLAQSPQLINYQGIARDANGNAITSAVKIKFELFPSLTGGSAAFSEVQTTTTNSLGIFSTQIGKTNPLNVNWGSGSWFLEVSIDPTNTGSSFTILGRQQLVSVPFALYASSAGSAPSQSLQINGNSLSISSGNTVTLPPPNNFVAGSGISISSGSVINNSLPDQTVSLLSGNNINVSGTYPTFSITSTPSLALSGNSLSISGNTNQIVLPTGTTYTNGAGISITSGSIITNTQPNQTVSILSGNNINVSGTYPTFSITSTPSLALSGNSLSISGNTNQIVLPTGTTYTNGAGISITSGSIITNTQPNQTVTLSGALVSGTYPNFTINSPAPTTVTGSSNVSVSGTSPNFTVNLQPTTVTSGSYGATPGVVPIFTVDAFGRITAANTYTLPTPPAGLNGNVQGAFGTTTVTAIQNVNLSTTTPTLNQVLGYNGTMWTPTTFNLPVGFNNGTLTVGSNSALIPGTGLWSSASGTAIVANNLSDFVGIGTNNPTHVLHTSGSNSAGNITGLFSSPQTSFRLHNDDLSGNNFSSVAFTTRSSASTIYESAKIAGVNNNHTSGSMTGDLVFLTRNASALNEVMRLNSTGNVGIGTLSPSERLEVAGNIEIPGSNEYQYSAAKTKYLSIPAAAFLSATPGTFNLSLSNDCVYVNGASAGFPGVLSAPVYLPDGATVTAVDAYVVDNDPSSAFNLLSLVRQPGVIGTTYGNSASVASISSTSGPGASSVIQKLTTSTITTPVIDNQNNSYFIRILMQQSTTLGDIRLARVVITYLISKSD